MTHEDIVITGIFNIENSVDGMATATKRCWSYIKSKRNNTSSLSHLRSNLFWNN